MLHSKVKHLLVLRNFFDFDFSVCFCSNKPSIEFFTLIISPFLELFEQCLCLNNKINVPEARASGQKCSDSNLQGNTSVMQKLLNSHQEPLSAIYYITVRKVLRYRL